MIAATNRSILKRVFECFALAVTCACMFLGIGCKKVPHAVKQAKAPTPTEKLVRELSASPQLCSKSFIDVAVALRDHLAGMQINLTVVLLPQSEAVQRDQSA